MTLTLSVVYQEMIISPAKELHHIYIPSTLRQNQHSHLPSSHHPITPYTPVISNLATHIRLSIHHHHRHLTGKSQKNTSSLTPSGLHQANGHLCVNRPHLHLLHSRKCNLLVRLVIRTRTTTPTLHP